MRSAWVLKLKPGQQAECKRKHNEIWLKMVALLKSQRVHNHSMYRHALRLFACLEKPEGAVMEMRAVNGVAKGRQAVWTPQMPFTPDSSPTMWTMENGLRRD